MTGRLITFEGGEGAGKTTQAEMLRAALSARGFAVSTVREPGGEPVSEAIRSVLLDATHPVEARTELLLFVASRAQLVERVIRPKLDHGEIVLCDRYGDSSVVYQGWARGQDLDTIRRLNSYATGGLEPDLTILLDIDPESGLGRQSSRNRMEAEPLQFHRTVRRGFLAEAALHPGRYRVIDAIGEQAAIHGEVLAAALAVVRPAEGRV